MHVTGTTPYPWPYDGDLGGPGTALLVVLPIGVDPPEATEPLAAAVRAAGGQRSIVVRTTAPAPGGHLRRPASRRRPRPASRTWTSPPAASTASTPATSTSCSAPAGSDGLLRTGVGLETCVHSTMRDANDRGYECLLVLDACVPIDPSLVAASVSSIEMSGGIFGAVGTSADVLAARPAARADRGSPDMTELADHDHLRPGRGRPVRVAVRRHLLRRHHRRAQHRLAAGLLRSGGYVDAMGYDLALTRAGLAPTAAMLAVARELGFHILRTREGHRADLSDLPANKLSALAADQRRHRGRRSVRPHPHARRARLGDRPRGRSAAGQLVIDKPGKGSFYATDLDLILRSRGITHIILTGITTDVCVHTTMHDANDRGYECLLLSDCTGATDHGNYLAALKMVAMQGGVFGAVADSAALLASLANPLPAQPSPAALGDRPWAPTAARTRHPGRGRRGSACPIPPARGNFVRIRCCKLLQADTVGDTCPAHRRAGRRRSRHVGRRRPRPSRSRARCAHRRRGRRRRSRRRRRNLCHRRGPHGRAGRIAAERARLRRRLAARLCRRPSSPPPVRPGCTPRTSRSPRATYEYKVAIDDSLGRGLRQGRWRRRTSRSSSPGATRLRFTYDDTTHRIALTPLDLGGEYTAADDALVADAGPGPRCRQAVLLRHDRPVRERRRRPTTRRAHGRPPGHRLRPHRQGLLPGRRPGGPARAARLHRGPRHDRHLAAPRPSRTEPVQGAGADASAGYHGYWITDFTQIDPHLGTNAELEALIADAHARGIDVYFDIITNHTADVIDYAEGDVRLRRPGDQPVHGRRRHRVRPGHLRGHGHLPDDGPRDVASRTRR